MYEAMMHWLETSDWKEQQVIMLLWGALCNEENQ